MMAGGRQKLRAKLEDRGLCQVTTSRSANHQLCRSDFGANVIWNVVLNMHLLRCGGSLAHLY